MIGSEQTCVNYKLVYCVESYARKHEMKQQDVFKLFREYKLPETMREFEDCVCCTDEDENLEFAEDYIDSRVEKAQ
jgi:hypothetical protein